MSAEYIMANGNYNVILCERGIRTFETSTRFTLDLNAISRHPAFEPFASSSIRRTAWRARVCGRWPKPRRRRPDGLITKCIPNRKRRCPTTQSLSGPIRPADERSGKIATHRPDAFKAALDWRRVSKILFWIFAIPPVGCGCCGKIPSCPAPPNPRTCVRHFGNGRLRRALQHVGIHSVQKALTDAGVG